MQSPANVKIEPKETVIEEYMSRLDRSKIGRITFVHGIK